MNKSKDSIQSKIKNLSLLLNFETVLAEKIQTVYNRGLLNSRNKDFYDIYIIYKLRWNEVNISNFQSAYSETCKYRNTIFTYEQAYSVVSQLSNGSMIKNRWTNYSNKNTFAKDISFEEIIKTCLEVTRILYGR